MLDCLELLHFHIGSKIPWVEVLNDGVSEPAYIYCDLVKLGANMKIIDIRERLGIDYEGTKSSWSDMYVSNIPEEYVTIVVKEVFIVVKEVCVVCNHT